MATSRQLSRRSFLSVSGIALGSALTSCAPSAPSTAAAPAEAPVSTPDQALARLIAGNTRYVANASTDLNESAARRAELAKGQQPFATIFSCIDSRVPPELVFDRGLGDLLVIRTAGQVIDSAVLGSLEYGVAELQIPLLVVLGHEKCGAVKATIETIEKNTSAPADINALVEAIRPAVEQAHGQPGDLLANAVNTNVALTVARLKQSPILVDALAAGRLKIVGARYTLESGVVDFSVA